MTGPRLALALAAALLATPNLAAPCLAQDYPAKPIRIIVPFGAGGPADVAARLLGNVLQEKFHQAIVIENRTGAGGVIGTGAFEGAATILDLGGGGGGRGAGGPVGAGRGQGAPSGAGRGQGARRSPSSSTVR